MMDISEVIAVLCLAFMAGMVIGLYLARWS